MGAMLLDFFALYGTLSMLQGLESNHLPSKRYPSPMYGREFGTYVRAIDPTRILLVSVHAAHYAARA